MLSLMKRGLGLCALALTVVSSAQAGEIRLLSFGGATNLPIWMAQEKGFMEKEGVKLTFATTNGSVEQIRDFYAGKYDVISTAFDNIVAYAEGQSDIPLPGPFDMFAFMGGHGGMNTLMVRPEIKGYADIKGKTVAVDALNSGYGLVLYNAGVDPAGDGVSQHDLVTREEIVFEWIDSQDSPAAFVLAGGYVGDGLTRTELVALHVATITKAQEIWARKQAEKQRRSNRWRLGEEEVRR